MKRRMTLDRLEKLNNSDSQELVTPSTSTPDTGRRPPPRSPLVTRNKYSTPAHEMVPKADRVSAQVICNNLITPD